VWLESNGEKMLPTFKVKTFTDAKEILNDHCLNLDLKKASSNKSASKKPNPDGAQKSWWLKNKDKRPPFDGPRCKAYLRAYIEIAGPTFYGSGIPLDDGLMHPDRGVMKALLQAGCVTLGKTKRGVFELTPKGNALIAGVDQSIAQQLTFGSRRGLGRLPPATREKLRQFVREKGLATVQKEIAHSIIVANQADPSKWGLRLNQKDIMLKVGFVEVLQAGDEWFHQLVKKNLVPKKLESDRRISFNNHSYKNAPGCITCDFDVSSVAQVYPALLPAHEAAIRVAALSPRHTTTKNDHSPNFIKFLSEQLNERLPQPDYYDNRLTTSVHIPEEMGDQRFEEGAAVQILVNRYERDPAARRRCIAHYRAVCAACGLSLADQYGPEVDGLIHVHHLTPLSSVGKQAVIDPVRDLRPVCPNCHAVIHSARRPRTIEQVKKMMRDRRAPKSEGRG
jgi:5-methylcytosine-specific restriction protein A